MRAWLGLISVGALGACNADDEVDAPPTDDAVETDLGTGLPGATSDTAPPPTTAGCEATSGREPLDIDAPSDGVVIRSPWTPVQVRTVADQSDASVITCLDGVRADDPLGVLSRRTSKTGGGWDYIGFLDLLAVAPGAHTLKVVLIDPDGSEYEANTTFTVDPPAHRVTVALTDASGAPAHARVVVTADGDHVDIGTPDDAAADPHLRDVGIHSFFVVDGVGVIDLDPGEYRLLVARGIRDELEVIDLVLDSDVTVTRTLRTPFADHDALAADLHVHSASSYDSHIPDVVRYWSLMGAGLDVAVMTDHNRVIDPMPGLMYVSPSNSTHGIPGVEADIREQGPLSGCCWDLAHINAFPTVDDDIAELPDLQPDSVGAYLDQWWDRQMANPWGTSSTDLLLQLNHPRGIHFTTDKDPTVGAWPLFNAYDFDPAVPIGTAVNAWVTESQPITGTTNMDFDAMEIINRFSMELYQQVRLDWFALLNGGVRITGTGNADSHAQQIEIAGFPVTFVDAPRPPAGTPLDDGSTLR